MEKVAEDLLLVRFIEVVPLNIMADENRLKESASIEDLIGYIDIFHGEYKVNIEP